MSNASLRHGNASHNLIVDIANIIGHGKADSPMLTIPILIEAEPLRTGDIITNLGFVLGKAELYSSDKKIKYGETTTLMSNVVHYPTKVYSRFDFLLNPTLVNKIDSNRKDNVHFTLVLNYQINIIENFKHLNPHNKAETINVVTDTRTAFCDVSFQIEQSQWVNKILPELGDKKYKLIELPTSSLLIPEEFKLSVSEFEQAHKYYLAGDYDKAVAHCRSAIDPFKVKFKEIKPFVDSKSEFEWVEKVLNATEGWLSVVIKATAQFTSKTHHPPSMGHFSRTEADIVLMITTAIIAYIGKLEYKDN